VLGSLFFESTFGVLMYWAFRQYAFMATRLCSAMCVVELRIFLLFFHEYAMNHTRFVADVHHYLGWWAFVFFDTFSA